MALSRTAGRRLLGSSLLLLFGLMAPLVKATPETPIDVWPGGAPGALGKDPGDIPTLTPYLPPKEKVTGAAVIVLSRWWIHTSCGSRGRAGCGVAQLAWSYGIRSEVSDWSALSSPGTAAGRGARDSDRAIESG
jgi:hypothetical protein